MLQTSLGAREVNCNIKFPLDAKLEYLSSSAYGVDTARCEFDGNMLKNDAKDGIPWGWIHPYGDYMQGWIRCKFKVTFSDGNDCTCQVTTKKVELSSVWHYTKYYIDHDGCECMRIKRCEGEQCPGDGNTGEWPCGNGGRYYAPQVTLTVESSWK